MNRTLSFLFAAALGATLGAFTALELAPLTGFTSGMAAMLGIIVGGLTGYIAVDFQQFCSGITYAASITFGHPMKKGVAYWESSREKKQDAIYASIAFCMVFMYWMIFPLSQHPDAAFVLKVVAIIIGMTVTLGHFAVYEEKPLVPLGGGRTMLYWLSPIGIAHFVFLKALPWLVVSLFKMIWWIARQTGVFSKTLFIAVHSERRMLCCLDATLGTVTGYYLGSWLAGTVAGLVFALLSYELVSKRWLKLQTI